MLKEQAEKLLREYEKEYNEVPFSRLEEFIELHKDSVDTLRKVINGEQVESAFD